MPRCPRCKRSFRVPEDEEFPPQHDCPHCGYGPDSESKRIHHCNWCGDEFTDGGPDHRALYYPYCSSRCATSAQADSREDECRNE